MESAGLKGLGKLGARLVRQPEEIVAGNRNERPTPSRFPKQRRSNPKNDVFHYFSIGYAKPL